MAQRKTKIGVVSLLGLIVGSLIWFLYAAYTGEFEPAFVSAVATAALVLVTTVSVTLTLILLDEERQARKQEIMPVFKTELKGVSIGRMGIALKNIGNGPAQNIDATLEIHPDGEKQEIQYPNVNSGDIVPISDPFEDTTINSDTIDEYSYISVEGTCEDIIGNKYDIDERLYLNSDNELGYPGLMSGDTVEDHLEDIAGELGDIEKELGDIERELGR